MNKMPATELEQWAILRTAVQAGSFAKAADILNRSQSSVSYAIARLQERLGVSLLRVEGRRAVLTPEGEQLLAEAAPLIDEMARVEERARTIAGGQEASLRLLVDSIAPRAFVFDALTRFRKGGGLAEIILTEQVRHSIDDLDPTTYDMAITFWDNRSRHAFHLMNVEMVAVANANHPLHESHALVTDTLLSRYPAAFVNAAGETAGRGIFKGQHVQVNTLEAALEAVRSGFCHARLPRHLIAADLQHGFLKEVRVRNSTRIVPLVLTFANEAMAGPLARQLADCLKAAFSRDDPAISRRPSH
jgi:DNA-binding transcriptional LysR family regulator